MNTPAHLLVGGALFGRASKTTLFAALAGSFLPDASLYIMGGVALWILQIPPQRVFNELYFSDAWQTVFAIDNSVLVWGMLLLVALRRGSDWGVALTAAALTHIALDFPLHHDDGRPHFWPLTNWVFESPISYWDRAHGASWVAPIEAVLALIAAVAIWFSHRQVAIAICVALLLAAEFWIVRQWLFFFVNS